MTKAEFDRLFKEEFSEFIKECKKTKDKVALRCAYNDFTDTMCKDGVITEKQYNTFTCPFKWVYQ